MLASIGALRAFFAALVVFLAVSLGYAHTMVRMKDSENGQGGGPVAHAPRVRLKDVAEAAGLSLTTVSRAFSRPGRVSEHTVRYVHEVANRLGYIPDQIAPVEDRRTLHSVIAVLVANLDNPVFVDMIHSLDRRFAEYGFVTSVVDFQEDPVREMEVAERLAPFVDALIFASPRTSSTSIRKIAQVVPTVAVDRVVRGVPSVVVDDRAATADAMEQLLRLGHGKVTYLSGPEGSWQDGYRWNSMHLAGRRIGMTMRRLPGESFVRDGGRTAVDEFLRTPTTALIAYDDLMAIGFMEEMRARGYAVPERCSVVGFDGIVQGAECAPALSTIAIDYHKLGEAAANHLITRLLHVGESAGPIVHIPAKFIPRASIAPAPPILKP